MTKILRWFFPSEKCINKRNKLSNTDIWLSEESHIQAFLSPGQERYEFYDQNTNSNKILWNYEQQKCCI